MKLHLIDLSKNFETARGSISAVRNIDLETSESEFFVLLGPSGCGKSTLLNLIAGLERPSRGEIRFGEKLVASGGGNVFLTPKERNVAMVFQSYALYPHMSVFENIAFPLRIAGQARRQIEESVQRVASMLGIAHLLRAKPGELSGGQRQRTAIGRAIVRQPSIFLLDEPLSNLDAQLRTATRIELKALQRQMGVTTVYVTHDQVEAMSLGHRIALMKDGGIEQVGAPGELYDRPANAFVARFIGSPPMNLLAVDLVEAADSWWIRMGRQKFPLSEVKRGRHLAAKQYLLGIRPEHIAIHADREDYQVRCRLLSVEPLGSRLVLQVCAEHQDLALLTDDTRYAEAATGTLLNVRFDLSRMYLFEAEGRQQTVFSSRDHTHGSLGMT
ncbi:ABC transporter ATP-binding protein [Desulfoferrobacter suflitae]|uniref:ABC transporter ATP-binding protein n=1 Tax=Desulfoferrobacter suflitae TaxID=2865782 RepID=UPI0021641318|nr:ABC transporter ATP-binding protein [Desulfoferrobacter suflitae]MCK8603054.1 ABC transporter ATP-binding protein [Desulfoferrobacter suflitae]